MLKRLKLKFICINMSIVTVMLLGIFLLLYSSAARNLEQQSLRMLEELRYGGRPGHGQFAVRPDNMRLPWFGIVLDGENNPVGTEGGFFDLSDEEELETIVRRTLAAGTETGILKDYRLRFLVCPTPTGQRLLYVEIGAELGTLRQLVHTFAALGIPVFAAFFLISVCLARWAVQPVAKAWQQQRQFAADASHELKTPLTVITTDAELLAAPDCPEADRERLTRSILAVSGQMRALVEGLLTLARMDSASAPQADEEVCLSDLVLDAAMTFEPVFFEKGLSLEVSAQPGIRLRGSGEQLNRLVGILLDNACKYSAPGGETMLTLTRISRRRCLLEAANPGNEIPPEELERIFERFYRADRARTRDGSFGLGLSIAAGIVHSHRGRIRAQSGGGVNRFLAELPVLEELPTA